MKYIFSLFALLFLLTSSAYAGINITKTDVSCQGGSDGSASVSVFGGGVAPFSYLWLETGDTGATISGLNAGNYTIIVTDSKGCEGTASVTIGQPSVPCGVTADIVVALQGAFNPVTGMMHTLLRNANKLPNAQPFNAAPWYYSGNETIATVPVDAVDWALIEIRDSNNGFTILEQKAGFILSDGSVTDLDGIRDGVQMQNIGSGNHYHIAIRTRNHLDIMSAVPPLLPNTTTFDFTQASNVMGGSNQLFDFGSGQYAMRAGDMDGNGILSVSDFNIFIDQLSVTNQYVKGDCTLDNTVSVSDFNLYQMQASVLGVPQIRY